MLMPEFRRFGFDPWAEMRRMHDEINRVFEEAPAGEFPPVNLWAGGDSAVVTAALPGCEISDVDVTVREDVLILRGKREPKVEGEEVTWHRRERDWGEFSRIVRLPFRVDPEKVQARLVNGLLEVELQRPEQDKPRKIRIQAS